mgnify:CR=1 FL=1
MEGSPELAGVVEDQVMDQRVLHLAHLRHQQIKGQIFSEVRKIVLEIYLTGIINDNL